jgi:hypothetical protein
VNCISDLHELGEPQFGVQQLPQESKEQVCKPLKTHVGRTQRVCISKLAAKNSPLVIYYMGICSTSGVFSLDKINENMQWEVVALLLLIGLMELSGWLVFFYMLVRV